MGPLSRVALAFWTWFFLPNLLIAHPAIEWGSDGLYYRAEEGSQSLQDVMALPLSAFQATHDFGPNLGFSSRPVWFHARLKNKEARAVDLVLEVAYPRIDFVDLHAVNARREVVRSFHSGTDTPHASRPIYHINFAFPLHFEAGEELWLYMRAEARNPLRFPVTLWETETFRVQQQHQQMIQGIYYGGIAIMVVYNMFVFFGTRNLSYLFYCAFVTCTASYLAAGGGWFLHYGFTNSSYWNNRIALTSALGANVFGIYFASYFMNLQKRDPLVFRPIRWLLVILFALMATIPIFPYHVVGVLLTLVSTANSIMLMVITFRGILRRQREAYFYAAAWTCLLIGTFAYGLLSLGFLPPNIFTEKGLQIGSFFEVTILSLALADRLNQLRLGLKSVNEQLAYQIEHVEEQVLVKTRDIRSIMEHIPLGVFSIIPGLLVHKDYSRSMETLFQQKDIEGREALAILFEHALISTDQKSQMMTALLHAIGEERIAFDFNRHCFIEQLVLEREGVQRVLNLLWNPVCDDRGIIEKILVTVHDITRLLALEQEAQAQRQELAIIQKILDVPAPRFHSFLRQAEYSLEESLGLWENGRIDPRGFHLILMHIHTLKGTARSLFFTEISDHCHLIEGLSQEHLLEELQALDKTIQQYREIAVEKLGRRLGSAEIVEVRASLLRDIVKDLAEQSQEPVAPVMIAHLQALETSLYRPLSLVLADCMKSSARLAAELGKPRPRIEIEAEGFGVTQAAYDALMGVLTHLLRNSLDHGLETSDARQAAGKPAEGLIRITAQTELSQLVVSFGDDGRGLALMELKALGLQRSLIPPEADPQTIAELIFAPSLSTREKISAVSGRGIGLSAVREIMRKEGGDVRLVLGPSSDEHPRFLLQLTLPAHFWTRLHQQALPLSA